MLNKEEIKAIIPHRDPFLLIDSIEELESGKRAVGTKHVTEDEYYFKGHFPGNPVMPGVLIIEALAQVGAVAILSMPEFKGKTAYFGGIEKARFKKMVRPGDTLRLEVEILRLRSNIGTGKATAYLGDSVAASGELMFVVAK